MKVTLRAARVNRDLTQDDAAKLIGVTKDTVGNWERGKSFPREPYIKAIERAYDCKYDDIIFLPRNYD